MSARRRGWPVAVLALAACYGPSSLERVEAASSSETTSDSPSDEMGSETSSESSSGIDGSTQDTSTGECDLGHFDQQAWDAACFAP